jgi:hypothetical protein
VSWVAGFVIALASIVGFSYAADPKTPRRSRRALFIGSVLVQWIFTVAPTVTDLLHHLAGPNYTLAEYHRDFFLSIPLQLMALKLLAQYLGQAGTVLREATWRLFLRGLGAEWVAPEPEIRVWVEGRSLNIEVPRPVDPDESGPGRTVV